MREKKGGIVIEKPAIRFSRLKETDSGNTQITYDYVAVGTGNVEGTSGLSDPMYDFTPSELETVEDMLMKRRYDVEKGHYPHITPDLAGITYPNTVMMYVEPS